MNPTFTLPYPEFAVANRLQSSLNRSSYSVCMPLSAQNKGYDLLVHARDTGRIASIQVKSSRPFPGRPPFHWNLWFNKISRKNRDGIQAFPAGDADFYLLFGLFPKFPTTLRNKQAWSEVLLLFSDEEMKGFCDKVGNYRFFSLSFDVELDHIHRANTNSSRVFADCYRDFLLENRMVDLKRFLAGNACQQLRALDCAVNYPSREIQAA